MQPYTDNFFYYWFDIDGKEISSLNLEATDKSPYVIAYCKTCGDPDSNFQVTVILADSHTNAVHLLNTASLGHIMCDPSLMEASPYDRADTSRTGEYTSRG